MALEASFIRYNLIFKQPAGTSRGVLRTKETFFLRLIEHNKIGIGECAVFRRLSYDDHPDYENKLKWLCAHIHKDKKVLMEELKEYPSIQFGLEQALLSLKSEDGFKLFPSDFTAGKSGIKINGLIWMGEKQFMLNQIKQKLKQGFDVIKLKIGAIDFQSELELLKFIRKDFSVEDVEIRVDANGAFHPDEALEKLKRLSDFDLHSIEQPIKAGQPDKMAGLCEKTPLPIALDEELIGIIDNYKKGELLKQIRPQYIILKPGLIGGFQGSNIWIDLAKEQKIGWWITSALESNIGLNAISQFTYILLNQMPQGLGTGSLFTNNIQAPLRVENGRLYYDPGQSWDLRNLKF
ncbi:MAG: o-succinylbenzoate synthase [Flavobacteriia bacterium]|nr:MAG: o-succinylbenzoate synthase [Flavobacteriia bacterium]